MSKKKIGIIIAVVVIVLAAAGTGAWYFLSENSGIGNSADKVYVESVASLNGSNLGNQNRYSGVVESQESWDVNKDQEREIKEVFVKVGDSVEEGTPLFEYDMESVKGELEQAKLDLEEMENDISSFKTQIDQLTKERNAAPADEKYEYTAGILEKENEIKQKEYDIESKKSEMEQKQESIDNAVVKSKLAGVVKTINESGTNNYGEAAAYMTVIAVGDYRVKGTVSETNIQMLSEDQPVILRSRIDENQTWNGTITKIDTQNEVQDNNNGYIAYDSDSSTEKATKYPFYVTLESTEGLMMGQHLFIEMDLGQSEPKEGIWIPESYIVWENETGETDGADMSGEVGSADGMDETGSADGVDETGSADSVDGVGEEGSVEDLEGSGSAEDLEGTEGGDEENTLNGEDMSGSEEGIDMLNLVEDGSDVSDDTNIEGIDTLNDTDMSGMDMGMGAAGGKAYVWAADSNNRLEKREIELGEYDANLGEYEVLSGLTEEDAIAFPMEGLYEGITTVTDMSEVDYSSPLYNPEGEGTEGEGSDAEGTEGEDINLDGGDMPAGEELMPAGEAAGGVEFDGGEVINEEESLDDSIDGEDDMGNQDVEE